MLIAIPARTKSWEVAATLQLISGGDQVTTDSPAIAEMVSGILGFATVNPDRDTVMFDYDGAYRRVDETEQSYVEVLSSGRVPVAPLPDLSERATGSVGPNSGILMAPFAVKTGLDLPVFVWRSIVTHLRTYGRVSLMSDPGEWMDACAFHENEIFSEDSMRDKLRALASADLVVGVPNAWMWLAAAWRKKLIVLYPQDVPPRRWYWYQDDNFARVVFDPRQLQIPVILAGLRSMIEVL